MVKPALEGREKPLHLGVFAAHRDQDQRNAGGGVGEHASKTAIEEVRIGRKGDTDRDRAALEREPLTRVEGAYAHHRGLLPPGELTCRAGRIGRLPCIDRQGYRAVLGCPEQIGYACSSGSETRLPARAL